MRKMIDVTAIVDTNIRWATFVWCDHCGCVTHCNAAVPSVSDQIAAAGWLSVQPAGRDYMVDLCPDCRKFVVVSEKEASP